ncbi:hypothetical protein GQ53DRAFT_614279, partial [Thozetella sp. PMI_491]
ILLCISFDLWYNTTTESTDFLLTFDNQMFSSSGRTAVGLGNSMFGALMFVQFRGENHSEKGHIEPRPFDKLPNLSVTNLAINDSHWFEASLICYSCDTWLSINKETGVQPFIRATNSHDTVHGLSARAKLPQHRFSGHFILD